MGTGVGNGIGGGIEHIGLDDGRDGRLMIRFTNFSRYDPLYTSLFLLSFLSGLGDIRFSSG